MDCRGDTANFFGFGSVPIESPGRDDSHDRRGLRRSCAGGERALVGAGGTDFGSVPIEHVKVVGQVNYCDQSLRPAAPSSTTVGRAPWPRPAVVNPPTDESFVRCPISRSLLSLPQTNEKVSIGRRFMNFSVSRWWPTYTEFLPRNTSPAPARSRRGSPNPSQALRPPPTRWKSSPAWRASADLRRRRHPESRPKI